MISWYKDAFFYHIYPLGALGAPRRRADEAAVVPRLRELHGWLDHLAWLGVSGLYLGPVFESTAHGYDTVDYFRVDRRLGTNSDLAEFVAAARNRGIRVILDAVLNHVGREFPAFLDVKARGKQSPKAKWIRGLNFAKGNAAGDSFSYEGWNGHPSLVCLDLEEPEVRAHLLEAVEFWYREFGISGLRLDAADCLSPKFIESLRRHCQAMDPDFVLMGEVIHGDYRNWASPWRKWAGPERLHSVTNYEAFKGLWSSHNDENYFEIAYSLDRQFGREGMYRDLVLYNFLDNHDVNRLASNLSRAGHLYPAHILMFTMPGIPSLYYGSEFGLPGTRTEASDAALRPKWHPHLGGPQGDLPPTIRKLAEIRRNLAALRRGSYRELYVEHRQFAFAREIVQSGPSVEPVIALVAVNSAAEPAELTLSVGGHHRSWVDVLSGRQYDGGSGKIHLTLDPNWGAILV